MPQSTFPIAKPSGVSMWVPEPVGLYRVPVSGRFLKPGDEGDDQLTPPYHPQLQVNVWAENLRSLHVSKGEAKLINDLSMLPLEQREAKKVKKWSLHLRLRERAVLGVRVGSNMVPGPLDMSDVRSWSSQAQEEHGASIEFAGNWMNIEESIVSFDCSSSNDVKMEEKEESVLSQVHQFNVVTPAVSFPSLRTDQFGGSKRTVDNFGSLIDNKVYIRPHTMMKCDTIKYNVDSELSYYAKVHLHDGSILELPGGKTQFIPTGDVSIASPSISQIDITLDNQEWFHLNQKDSHFRSWAIDRRRQLQAMITLPSKYIIRNKTCSITGKLHDTLDMKKIKPKHISAEIISTVKSDWVRNKLQDYRPDLIADMDQLIQDKLMNANDPIRAPLTMPSVETILKEEIEKRALPIPLRHKPTFSFGRHHSKFHYNFDKGDNHSFAIDVCANDNVLTSHSNAFERVEMLLKIEFQYDLLEQYHSEYTDPIPVATLLGSSSGLFGRIGNENNVGKNVFGYDNETVAWTAKAATKWNPPLVAYLPIIVMGEEEGERCVSSSQDARQGRPIYSYLHPMARAPRFECRDESQSQYLLNDEENFPLISATSKRETMVHNAGQGVKSEGFVSTRFLQPEKEGVTNEEVGARWAKEVLLPLHQEKGPSEDTRTEQPETLASVDRLPKARLNFFGSQVVPMDLD